MTRGSDFLRLLEERTVLFDGAMGSLLLSQDLDADDYRGREGCCEILNLTRPDLVMHAHVAYLEAGADVLETNTFQGSRPKLEEQGFGDEAREINLSAARIAKQAADSFSTEESPRFVIGSIGPTGRLPSSADPLLSISFDLVRKFVAEQAEALLEGGVDALLLETQQDILETKAGIFGIRDAFARTGIASPVLVHVALDKNGRMLLGTDLKTASAILEPFEIVALGIDCSSGPDEMRDHVRALAESFPRFVSCIPNAGQPVNRDGVPFYPLGPVEMAESLVGLAEEYGLDVIGGCCGSTPAHIREIRRRLGKKRQRRAVEPIPSVAGPFRRVPLRQEPRPLIVGERLSVTGSRKTRDILDRGDYEALVSVALSQESAGCHLLDVSMAGPDEKTRMVRAVREISRSVETPLVIDARESEVIEAALEVYPGRALVNSLNLEKGKENLVQLLSLVKRHGACAVLMTITESGMALTAEDKQEAVDSLREIALKDAGLTDSDVLYDLLTLPLSTGDARYQGSARETLNGLAELKKRLPRSLTILGISNVSYGLPAGARRYLNSAFLYHAIGHGLDAAIVNAPEVIPYRDIPETERGLCEDLVFNRSDSALPRLIESLEKRPKMLLPETTVREELSLEGAIRSRVLNRTHEGLEELLERAVQTFGARSVLEGVLLPAMEEVGRRFDRGEMILPFVLQAAEVMSRAMRHLEKHLEMEGGVERGKLVLATVFGDVHDIGKNLVRSIMSNNGYTVYDLGKRVPVEDIIRKAADTGADAIGLSALLVSTSREMKHCVGELARAGMSVPVIIGGAAVNRLFASRISILEGGSVYPGGVFYAKDAFEGLEIMNSLVRDREAMLEGYRQEVEDCLSESERRVGREPGAREIDQGMLRIVVPFRGVRTLRGVDPAQVFPYLRIDSLFRRRWAGNKGYPPSVEREEFAPALEELKRELAERGLLHLMAVYGYFECTVFPDSLAVEREGKTVSIRFSRDSVVMRCFMPPGSRDVVALAVVTVGGDVKAYEDSLVREGKTKKAFYVHGLSAEMAEALAGYLQVRMGMEMGVQKGMGRRYSPGYASWPDLSEQSGIFSILGPEEEIGVGLTESYQMVPEHSISFLLCPRAKQ